MTERPEDRQDAQDREEELEVERETVKDLEPEGEDQVRGGGYSFYCAGQES